jgi:amino acid transporter
MCLLTALVGVNYMAICRHYPDGGGVYASVRHRSEIISIVGTFLLLADYIVTAAISTLSAFQYLGVSHPELFAGALVLLIGGLNYFGPRHTGGLAFLVSVPTATVVVLLGVFTLPHLSEALDNLKPLSGGFFANWSGFVGIVLALSGVEAIANATSVMKLNPGSSEEGASSTDKKLDLAVWERTLMFGTFLVMAAIEISLILGAPQRNMVVNLLRGNIIRNISSILPDEIDLIVYA